MPPMPSAASCGTASPRPRAARSAIRRARSRDRLQHVEDRESGPCRRGSAPRQPRAESRSRRPAPTEPATRARYAAPARRQRAGAGCRIRAQATARRTCRRLPAATAPARCRDHREAGRAVPAPRRCSASTTRERGAAGKHPEGGAERDPRSGGRAPTQGCRRRGRPRRGRAAAAAMAPPVPLGIVEQFARGQRSTAASKSAPSSAMPAVERPVGGRPQRDRVPETSRFGARLTKPAAATAAAAAITSTNSTWLRTRSGKVERRPRPAEPKSRQKIPDFR